MFDFCKLDVYQKAKTFCILMHKFLFSALQHLKIIPDNVV